MNKMAIAGVAVLLIGSSAALAQPYGYGNRHDYREPRSCANPDRAYDAEMFRRGRMDQIINCIGDPATGMHITQQEYLNKYPWSDVSTWVYNPALDIWADNTPNKDYLFAQGDRRYSRNYYPDYRSNYQYRDRRYRE